MQQPLEPPHSFHLRAAQGWLELGDAQEARAELAQLAASHPAHPDVLECRWQLAAHEGLWETCVSLAETIITHHSDLPAGWIHRSYALHELKRTAEARDNLMKVIEQFPDETTMHYNLACYECRLGNLALARRWLKQAMKLGGHREILDLALADPDLKALSDEWKAL